MLKPKSNASAGIIQIVDRGGSGLKDKKNDILGLDISGQKFYQAASKNQKIYWSNTFLSTITGKPSFALYYPNYSGLIVVNFSLVKFSRVLEHLNLTSKLDIFLIGLRSNRRIHPHIAIFTYLSEAHQTRFTL